MTMVARLLNTQPGDIRRRLAWLLWRRHTFRLSRWWMQATCSSHVVDYVRVGRLADILAGGGEYRATCMRCGKWDVSWR